MLFHFPQVNRYSLLLRLCHERLVNECHHPFLVGVSHTVQEQGFALVYPDFRRKPPSHCRQRQTDRVIAWAMADTVAQSGRPMIRIDVQTEYRAFSFWFQKAPSNYYAQKDKEMLDNLKGEWPKTITYQKEADSKFYRVYGYNRKADEAP